jgi:threonine synthase
LVEEGVIGPGERVLCILTGHLLKDTDTTIAYHLDEVEAVRPYANRPILVGGDPDEVRRAVAQFL